MKKLALLIPIIALIIGCGGEEENYFPLTVGNTWDYEMTTTTIIVIDTVTSDTTVDTGAMDLDINEETTLDNGTDVFEMITTVTFDDTLIPSFADTSYIDETEDYLLEYSTKADTVPSDTMLALPLEAGKTWADYEAIGQENVTVPAGTFNDCWKVRGIDNSDTMYMYLAPDVGMVKMSQDWAEADSITHEMLIELKTYTVK
jgi:hypothetical protein